MNVIRHKFTIEEQNAELELILWENSQEFFVGKIRPFILVCPGGGYGFVSDREADTIAMQFIAMGYHAGVLRYTVGENVHYPVHLRQAAYAVAYIRSHAEEYFVDSNKIIVTGFSAGGHLAASLGKFWDEPDLSSAIGKTPEAVRPNGLILGYPVIKMDETTHAASYRRLMGDLAGEPVWEEKLSLQNGLTEKMPPCFIWHTWEDKTVLAENSLSLASSLRKAGVPFELHIYQRGKHGLSLANEQTAKNEKGIQPAVQQWISQVKIWLRELFAESSEEQ